MNRFIYLKTGLAFILAFVGIKMVVADIAHVPNWLSLLVIISILGITITSSMWKTKRDAANSSATGQPPIS
jgi:tellurite resistance protein TerC